MSDPDQVSPSGRVEDYRVEPTEDGEGEWHVLTFENGVQVQIFTDRPLLIVQPERM